MKLERYKDKKETRKKVMLISLTLLTIVSVTMMLYKTFANFRTSTSFSIMSGKVVYKKKSFELGKDIPVSPDGSANGLFAVTPTGPSGWTKQEYRYAGSNPDNYVYFNCNDGTTEQNTSNCELWRIIGLVNVKTSSGQIEQRLKIIRNDSIGEYAWHASSGYESDWNKSGLKDMLNGIYYDGTSGTCYALNPNDEYHYSYKTNCNFSSNGLKKYAKELIDVDLIWNIARWSDSNVTTDVMYGYERGTSTNNNQPSEWSVTADVGNKFKGIGLIYPSDYGYAVGGNVRKLCLAKNLYDYDKNNCYQNDWLYLKDKGLWTITAKIDNMYIMYIESDGCLLPSYAGATAIAKDVKPVVFLKSNVVIIDGEGTVTTPYVLSIK